MTIREQAAQRDVHDEDQVGHVVHFAEKLLGDVNDDVSIILRCYSQH